MDRYNRDNSTSRNNRDNNSRFNRIRDPSGNNDRNYYRNNRNDNYRNERAENYRNDRNRNLRNDRNDRTENYRNDRNKNLRNDNFKNDIIDDYENDITDNNIEVKIDNYKNDGNDNFRNVRNDRTDNRNGRNDRMDNYRNGRNDRADKYRYGRNDRADRYRNGRNDRADNYRNARNDNYRTDRNDRSDNNRNARNDNYRTDRNDRPDNNRNARNDNYNNDRNENYRNDRNENKNYRNDRNENYRNDRNENYSSNDHKEDRKVGRSNSYRFRDVRLEKLKKNTDQGTSYDSNNANNTYNTNTNDTNINNTNTNNADNYNTDAYNTETYNTNNYNTETYNTNNYNTETYNTDTYETKTYNTNTYNTEKAYNNPDTYDTNTNGTNNYNTDTYRSNRSNANNYNTDTYRSNRSNTNNYNTDTYRSNRSNTNNYNTDTYRSNRSNTNNYNTDTYRSNRSNTNNYNTDTYRSNRSNRSYTGTYKSNRSNTGNNSDIYSNYSTPVTPVLTNKKPNKIKSALLDPNVQAQLANQKKYKPIFIYTITVIQIIVTIVSLILNNKMTGKLIAPLNENYFIGPSSGVLVKMGARYMPCMNEESLSYECPNGIKGSMSPMDVPVNKNESNFTLYKSPYYCTVNDICGFGASGDNPNQWFRFILPIFIHGGFVHLILNLFIQIRIGAALEKDYGSWRIAVIYFLSGIFGFIFEAKSSGNAPTVGCSGSLYGLIACILLDLIQNWKIVVSPVKDLILLIISIVISLGFGLLPFIDNFSHIGGFVMGIFSGLIFLPSIIFNNRDGKIKLYLRIASIIITIGLFVWVILQFYRSNSYCVWCQNLSCPKFISTCKSKYKDGLDNNENFNVDDMEYEQQEEDY